MKEILNYSGFRKAVKQTLIIIDGVFIYHACDMKKTWWSLFLFLVAAIISRIIVEIKTDDQE